MSCHGFLKNIKYVFILKCHKRLLEYYFSKGFTILECNTNDFSKLLNEVKDRNHAEEIENSDKVMTCTNKTPPSSNTLKKLVVNKIFILPIFEENSMKKSK